MPFTIRQKRALGARAAGKKLSGGAKGLNKLPPRKAKEMLKHSGTKRGKR